MRHKTMRLVVYSNHCYGDPIEKENIQGIVPIYIILEGDISIIPSHCCVAIGIRYLADQLLTETPFEFHLVFCQTHTSILK